MNLKSTVKKHAAMLRKLSEDSAFTVFLCGPRLNADKPTPESKLRQKLITELESKGFEVVLGEDEGLEDERLNFGLNAQDNELEFISRQCNAVIIIAASVGAFCELGLFSWHFVHETGLIGTEIKPAFIVLVSEKYEDHQSYLNQGPVNSILGFGDALYVDYEKFDPSKISKILTNKRSIQTLDKRGRPRGTK